MLTDLGNFGVPMTCTIIDSTVRYSVGYRTEKGTPLKTVHRLGQPPEKWKAFYKPPPPVQWSAGTGASLVCYSL